MAININEKIKQYMLAKDTNSLELMRSIKTAFTNLEKEKQNVTDTDYLMLLKKLSKQRLDSAEIYLTNKRMDLYEKEMFEFDKISELLPKNLTVAEVMKLIKEVKTQSNLDYKKDMGKLVKLVVEEAAGTTDGKTVSSIIRDLVNAE